MKLMDISEVAKRSGMPAATLRFYEETGLIESLGRRGLRRTFDPDVLGRLSLIALGRMADFSLDEIGALLGSRQQPEIDRALLARKADELGRMIKQLGALRIGLQHAATCPAPTHMQCPSFRRLMKVAAARKPRPRSVQKRMPAT